MEQMYLDLMQAARTTAEQQRSSRSEGTGERGGAFQQLLEKRRAAEQPEELPADAAGQPVAVAPEEEQDGSQELIPQEQLLAAAMAAMQNQVVSLEEPVTAAQETPVTAIAAQPAAQAPETAPAVAQQTGEQPAAELRQSDAVPADRQPMAPAGEGEAAQTAQTTGEQREPSLSTEGSGRQGDSRRLDVTERTDGDGGETAVFRDVREIPVKVGEADAAGEAELTASVREQVSEKLAGALEKGGSRLTIQLTPEHLGTIEVRMTVTEDGRLLVALHAENHQTRELLAKGVDGLQAMLSRDLQQEVQVEVPRQEDSRQQSFDDGQHHHQQQEDPRHDRERERSGDFLQQLRLGLLPLEEEAS